MKNKKERDWKFIIGLIVLLAIFAVMGGAFWNMVGKQAQMVREEEQKEEANAIPAIYIETGEFLKTGVFVDLNNGTIFSADIPAEGIYNKKGKLISDDVLENGDKVKIYGDDIRNGRGITCSDPTSCTCKCVRTGDHADRTGNTHYQAGTG